MEIEKTDGLDAAADEAIAICGGDARAGVKALLIAKAYLEDELKMAVPAVSYGFSRGWHAKRRDSAHRNGPAITEPKEAREC